MASRTRSAVVLIVVFSLYAALSAAVGPTGNLFSTPQLLISASYTNFSALRLTFPSFVLLGERDLGFYLLTDSHRCHSYKNEDGRQVHEGGTNLGVARRSKMHDCVCLSVWWNKENATSTPLLSDTCIFGVIRSVLSIVFGNIVGLAVTPAQSINGCGRAVNCSKDRAH